MAPKFWTPTISPFVLDFLGFYGSWDKRGSSTASRKSG